VPIFGPVLGLLMGLSLGTLGGGGSTIAIPIFLYIYGYSVKSSIAMGLGVVAVASAAGALSHARAGRINLRAALHVGPFAMAGTFLGARSAERVSDSLQLMLFAVVVLISASFMLLGPKARLETAELPGPHGQHPVALALIGMFVGVITGLLGVGGGFLIVPALVLLAGVPMKQAVGTSLAIMTVNAISGFLGYLGLVPIHWLPMALFLLLAVLGVLTGSRISHHLSPLRLQRIFAIFLLLVGSGVLLLGNPRHAAPARETTAP